MDIEILENTHCTSEFYIFSNNYITVHENAQKTKAGPREMFDEQILKLKIL